jgi:hypothetical protein
VSGAAGRAKLAIAIRSDLLESEAQLAAVVAHEVGHALGMTEADLDAYTIGNEPHPDAAPVRRLEDA